MVDYRLLLRKYMELIGCLLVTGIYPIISQKRRKHK